MKRLFTLGWLTILISIFAAHVMAQKGYVVSGEIKDATTKEILIGATVQIKGTVNASATNTKGFFELKTSAELPFILVFSLVGYETQEFEVKDLNTPISIALNTQPILGREVVVTASRIEESIMKSPVSIDKLSLREIKESPAANFYDAMENVKGVQMITSGLNFRVPNTRGFNAPNNFRFMQLVDGTDMLSATIGQSLSNTLGPTDLDIESVEITPGASSALYGMNAINGMSNMTSKSPFKYRGLSVYNKAGVNHINDGTHAAGLYDGAIRYATVIGNRVGVKFNFGYMYGTDWFPKNNSLFDVNNNTGDNTNINPKYPQLSGPNGIAADPVNSLGNESAMQVSVSDNYGHTLNVRRTGYNEQSLWDFHVKNIKADAAVHYRITDKLEAIASFRYGTMDGVFQRGNPIVLQGLVNTSSKLELKGSNFFIRGYVNSENTGNSYNMAPLANNLELSFKSNAKWASDYTTALNTAEGTLGMNLVQANQYARAQADNGRFQPGNQAFNNQLNVIKGINNWDIAPIAGASTTGGAALHQKSFIYHVEGQYDFSKYTKKIADVQVGYDFRTIDIVPDGNNFVDFSRSIADRGTALSNGTYGSDLYYTKTGGYVQASRSFLENRLKAVASIRYDKNFEFEGKWNPRVALIYSPNDNHSIRASYQNGFRFPSVFEAFSFVNNQNERRVGGLAQINNGLNYLNNSYLLTSVNAFNTAVTNDVNAGMSQQQAAVKEGGLLQKAPLNPNGIQPERINSIEVGYKGIFFDNKLSTDWDIYYNIYDNYISQVRVVVPTQGTIGGADNATTQLDMLSSNTRIAYRPYVNSLNRYWSYGSALKLSYNIYGKYNLSGSVNFNNFVGNDNPDVFIVSYNTPKWAYNVSFGNREIIKNLGFNVLWRWQQGFKWYYVYGNGDVPGYGSLDAQLTYKIPQIFATAKLGATNILNTQYYQYIGGPTIGSMYYLAVTFDLPDLKDVFNK